MLFMGLTISTGPWSIAMQQITRGYGFFKHRISEKGKHAQQPATGQSFSGRSGHPNGHTPLDAPKDQAIFHGQAMFDGGSEPLFSSVAASRNQDHTPLHGTLW